MVCCDVSVTEPCFFSPSLPPQYQDFRNYQYTLPVVTGLVVDLEVRRTCIKIPSNRYNEVGITGPAACLGRVLRLPLSTPGPFLHTLALTSACLSDPV